MSELAIEEFVVRVGADRRIEAQWQHAGSSQSITGTLDIDDLRLRTVNAFVDLLRSNRLRKVDELKLLGEHLFVTLFGPPEDTARHNGPGMLFRQAIQGEGEQDGPGGRLLRIVLEVGAGAEWLASWPWEYLYVPLNRDYPYSDFFLGESRKFMLTRKLPLAVAPRMIQVRPPLRVLFVVLGPSNLDPIEYEAVLETLTRLRDAGDEERIDLRVLSQEHGPDGTRFPADEDLAVQATWASFLNSVEQFDPHIVHVISHGRYSADADGGARGEVAFPSDDTTAEWIADRDLANQLNESGSSLRLVFLQSCESATSSSNQYHVISGMAQSLAQKNIPAVVAMHFKIKSLLANTFARAFYENLVARHPIEVAMHVARRQLYLGGMADEANRSGFGLPVLYLRESSPLLTPPVPRKAPPSRRRSARVAVPGGTEDRADAAQLLARLDQPDPGKAAWRRADR
ncbi:CHAT domain-containing protein [Dactylosporangium sp. CS-033363]|uniref:CHAT domain-containing protein n=1 Tax=Dactylosporangium sp. CS-033363 TaxID=3239935 RepID=UPI003D905455